MNIRKRFEQVFLPGVSLLPSKPVVLVIDSCGQHALYLKEFCDQFSVSMLQNNFAYINHPVILVVIASWKMNFDKKAHFIGQLINNIKSKDVKWRSINRI